MSELLRLAYGSHEPRRLDLDANCLWELTLDFGATEDDERTLARLGNDDVLLEGPPRLLVALAEHKAHGDARRQILRLTERAMLAHPAFRHLGSAGHVDALKRVTTQEVLEYVRKAADGDLLVNRVPAVGEARESAAEARSALAAAGAGSQGALAELKKRASEADKRAIDTERRARTQLERNAVTVIGLHRVLSRDWELAEFVSETQGTLWGDEKLDRVVARDAVALAMATQRRPLGILTAVRVAERAGMERELRTARTAAANDRRFRSEAEENVSQLESAVADAHARESLLHERLAALQDDIERERQNRDVDRSHLVDDYEVLRTQVLRRLSSQTEMLRDGLYAIRANKTDIADEFVDVALRAIEQEIVRLRGLGDGER